MKLKDRIKSYKFWVALSASLVILLKTLGSALNFEVSEEIINGLIMGFCGVLVVLGVVEKPVQTIAEQENQNQNNEKTDDK
ncbi:MAG: hypothetical protein PHQ62_02865 [Clostridia bacterium]|nr:hypothetical protein [Clostridia bacterium]